MERIACILIGYAFGNFLTADLVARAVSKESAFSQGSGNPGMANISSLYGAKRGALVLLGDLAMTFIPCLACRFILFPRLGSVAAAWTGLGVILGHDYPVWHRFRGGKGVTSTCAAAISISFFGGIFACLVGLIGLIAGHYLTTGALLVPIAFLIPAFLFCGPEVGVLAVVMLLVMLERHRKSLAKIRDGTEKEKKIFSRKGRKDGER